MKKINDNLLVTNIRILGTAMVQKASSGHPGIVLGLAPTIYVLFKEHLKFNNQDPGWFNRDRFILSAGHGSALLYSIMYMVGYPISIEDLKQFRQYGSKTAGHPEYWDIAGIEATTGPLGQGVAMGIGMALAEKNLNAKIIDNNESLYDHHTFIICSDGDLQEGISYESMSLAGRNELSKLIILYDSNGIQLDGKVDYAFNENIKKRVEAQGFEYFRIDNGNDIDEIDRVIKNAKSIITSKPRFIEVKTIIGYGSENENTSKVHGAPLLPNDFIELKKFFEFNHDNFYIYEEERETLINYIYTRNVHRYNVSIENFKKYNDTNFNIKRGEEFISYEELLKYNPHKKLVSSRELVGNCYQSLCEKFSFFFGGSADLRSSTKILGGNGNFTFDNPQGREIWYGVREFSMAAIVNGITLHGNIIGYGATFFSFADYTKPALRLASLMKIPSIMIYSHDSIFLGEDGPTHQPIEQLSMVREIINMNVWRPANFFESITAIKQSIDSIDCPNIIVTSRQNFQQFDTVNDYQLISNGAYQISDFQKEYDLIILTSGSEIAISFEVSERLKEDNIISKIISVPCLDRFIATSEKYQKDLLENNKIPIYVIEASKSSQWYRYVKPNNYFGVFRYSHSGNYKDVLKNSNLNPNNVYKKIIKDMKG